MSRAYCSKKRFSLVLAATIAAALIAILGAVSTARSAPGLLLVAHGSPSPAWNKPVLKFGETVAVEAEKEGQFKAVRLGLLESAKPDIATAVAELEAAGCDRIVAVPLFVAPSGHTHFDVPAALGIYTTPRIKATLAAEGTKAATPRVPITLTATLAEGDLLSRYALDEARKLSKSPQDEAIVILAHGDPDHQLQIERLLRQVTTYCCGKAGVSYGDWACIGVGQEYPTQGVAAIRNALQEKKRVLVVGLYLSTTAARIHQRSAPAAGHGPRRDPFEDKDVVMSDRPIIDHPQFLRWVLDSANSAI